MEKLKAQEGEGCHMWGTLAVNKVPFLPASTLQVFCLPTCYRAYCISKSESCMHQGGCSHTAACSAGSPRGKDNVSAQQGFNSCCVRRPVLGQHIEGPE